MLWHVFFYFVVAMLIPNWVTSYICSRYPTNTNTAKSPIDENFAISVAGNPQTYLLGQKYNITLNAFNGARFMSFIIALENSDGITSVSEDMGYFEISDLVETRYKPRCINMVENTNTKPKTSVNIAWVAPSQPGVGCVLIRATLVQHRDVWYMDDGGLTKRICEETTDEMESQSTSVEPRPCCACDEARYELSFASGWSRNLHPKEFPMQGWITRFSDIIGAGHSNMYRFWENGALASEGMKQLAEHGSAQLLEEEFHNNMRNGNIRTIIKARGPAFPHLNGQAVASVRVDSQHNMISLVSKIEPSPDWIIGIAGLDLCLPNCTWLENKVINLYPWDIGTDAGPSYTSADQPQVPADVIRRIRSDSPNDPRSPFYDETGAPMKPLALLTVKRKRLYNRICEENESNNIDVPQECETYPWSVWSKCTANCGEGVQYRRRVYKQPNVAKIYNCDVVMMNEQERPCTETMCKSSDDERRFADSGRETQFRETVHGDITMNSECRLSEWSDWSSCNSTCGEGVMMRQRRYFNPMMETKCQRFRYNNLYEYRKCIGRDCLRETSDNTSSEKEHMELHNDFENQHEGNDQFYPSHTSEANNEISNDLQPAHENRNYYPLPAPPDNDYYSNHNFPIENLQKAGGKAEKHTNNIDNPGQHSNVYETSDISVPVYCYQPLKVNYCVNATAAKNFWFYNFCHDECMLFAADTCDQNTNKFTTLELCELRCRDPANNAFLRNRQQKYCKRRRQENQ